MRAILSNRMILNALLQHINCHPERSEGPAFLADPGFSQHRKLSTWNDLKGRGFQPCRNRLTLSSRASTKERSDRVRHEGSAVLRLSSRRLAGFSYGTNLLTAAFGWRSGSPLRYSTVVNKALAAEVISIDANCAELRMSGHCVPRVIERGQDSSP